MQPDPDLAYGPSTGVFRSQITSLLLLWANGGEAHGFEEYRAWLADAGFAQIRQLGERRLMAGKAE
jgi:hypothetical protein